MEWIKLLINVIFYTGHTVVTNKKWFFQVLPASEKFFFSDSFSSKLNGLQRRAKDFFGKLDADDKKFKM